MVWSRGVDTKPLAPPRGPLDRVGTEGTWLSKPPQAPTCLRWVHTCFPCCASPYPNL